MVVCDWWTPPCHFPVSLHCASWRFQAVTLTHETWVLAATWVENGNCRVSDADLTQNFWEMSPPWSKSNISKHGDRRKHTLFQGPPIFFNWKVLQLSKKASSRLKCLWERLQRKLFFQVVGQNWRGIPLLQLAWKCVPELVLPKYSNILSEEWTSPNRESSVKTRRVGVSLLRKLNGTFPASPALLLRLKDVRGF